MTATMLLLAANAQRHGSEIGFIIGSVLGLVIFLTIFYTVEKFVFGRDSLRKEERP